MPWYGYNIMGGTVKYLYFFDKYPPPIAFISSSFSGIGGKTELKPPKNL